MDNLQDLFAKQRRVSGARLPAPSPELYIVLSLPFGGGADEGELIMWSHKPEDALKLSRNVWSLKIRHALVRVYT